MGFLAPARSQTNHYRQVSGFVTGKCLIFRRVVAGRARQCPCSLYLQGQRLNCGADAALQQYGFLLLVNMTQPPETAPLQATGSASAAPPRARRLSAPIIPIRPIGPEHRAQLLRHFLALGPDDRYLRFGYAASDERVRLYVDSIRFESDEIFGVFNRKLELLAVAHIAIEPGQTERAEFGVSVLPKGRGLGIGTRLFARAAVDARNRGLRVLYMQCLSSNAAMLKIARRAGMKVRNEGGETEAYLELPEDTYQSHLDALVENQTGQIDYWIKAFMRQWRCFWLFGRCPDPT